LYEASDHGRVRSLDRYIEYNWKGKTMRRIQKGKVLSDKCNNRADNLEWVTQKENITHAWEMGLCSGAIAGVGHHNSKLTEDDVRWIRENDRTTNGGNMNREEMAKVLGVSGVSVTNVANRKTWRHVV